MTPAIKIEGSDEATPSAMTGIHNPPPLGPSGAHIAPAPPPVPNNISVSQQNHIKQEHSSLSAVNLPQFNQGIPPHNTLNPTSIVPLPSNTTLPAAHHAVHVPAPISLAPAPAMPNTDKAAVAAAARAAAMAPSVPRPVTVAAPALSLPMPDMMNKSSKKSKGKSQVTVTMATAATATPANNGPGSQGENTGRWTAEEHRLFLQGLEQHGKGWKKIASLIKSRTVVQIRTHAQKYFQKLAKARQNGEEGDISMEGRGGIVGSNAQSGAGSVGNLNGAPAQCSKRRRQATGTKRKAISGIVSSAQQEGKRLAIESSAAGASPASPPLPVLTPILAPYVVPSPVHPHAPPPQPTHLSQHPTPSSTSPTVVTTSVPASKLCISGPALEDSLFRFLTPAANELMSGNQTSKSVQAPASHVNEVARLAGAPPIVVPSDNNKLNNGYGGEGSPTGVSDINNFPTWIDCEPPAWYTKGSDVDELLNEADALDWLADSGDLDENYKPPPSTQAVLTQSMEPSLISLCDTPNSPTSSGVASTIGELSSNPLPPQKCDSVSNIPPLPSLFGSSGNIVSAPVACEKVTTPNLSSASLFGSASEEANATDGLAVFESHFDEQAFVTALLENNDSTNNLGALQ